MILLAILIFASADNTPMNFTNLGACAAGNTIKVDSIQFTNFPPHGNSFTVNFKGTLLYPVLVDQAEVALYGNNGFSTQNDAYFCLPPVPYPPIEFSIPISVSNKNDVSYVMTINIGNCFEILGCFRETFAIWKNLN